MWALLTQQERLTNTNSQTLASHSYAQALVNFWPLRNANLLLGVFWDRSEVTP